MSSHRAGNRQLRHMLLAPPGMITVIPSNSDLVAVRQGMSRDSPSGGATSLEPLFTVTLHQLIHQIFR